jgi:putative membrane protein
LDEDDLAVVVLQTNPADAILRIASLRLAALHGRAVDPLDSISTVAVTNLLDKLGETQGACERIASTPLPFPYTLLVHRTT